MISKSDIVSKVSEVTGETKSKVETYVNATFDAIASSLSTDEVRIHGFGTFKVKDTPARKGRNPATGEAIDVPASRKVSFKQADQLKGKL